MPKKRHYARYSKPQSTAPHSLESSGLQSSPYQEDPKPRSVNDLLASLRRASLASPVVGSVSGGGDDGSGSLAAGAARLLARPPLPVVSPSMPPEIAHILLPGLLPPASAAAPAALLAPHAHGNAVHGAGRGGLGIGGANGPGPLEGPRRRAPAGPAPPASWLAQSRHAPWRVRQAARRLQGEGQHDIEHGGRSGRHSRLHMPGVTQPDKGSLVDMTLRSMALDWDVQKQFYRHDLIYLQGSLRAALVSYLTQLSEGGRGVSIGDLKALLLPPRPLSEADAPAPDNAGSQVDDGWQGRAENRGENGDGGDDDDMLPDNPSTFNEDFTYLDVTLSVGQSFSVRELNDLLFPGKTSTARWPGTAKQPAQNRQKPQPDGADGGTVADSWDMPSAIRAMPLPQTLLPNLTHLSLALVSDRCAASTAAAAAAPPVSWRQLLAFAAHLPMLTHLSLAYWPEPTLTPNAKFATAFASSPLEQRLPYDELSTALVRTSNSSSRRAALDNVWAEAVLLVRKLSKALYGLEYLDLTGCAPWFPALMHRVDGSGQVDWVGDWGKVTTLVLRYGGGVGGGGGEVDLQPGETARSVNAASEARMIERHIRQLRAGRGRFITVVYDKQT